MRVVEGAHTRARRSRLQGLSAGRPPPRLSRRAS